MEKVKNESLIDQENIETSNSWFWDNWKPQKKEAAKIRKGRTHWW